MVLLSKRECFSYKKRSDAISYYTEIIHSESQGYHRIEQVGTCVYLPWVQTAQLWLDKNIKVAPLWQELGCTLHVSEYQF